MKILAAAAATAALLLAGPAAASSPKPTSPPPAPAALAPPAAPAAPAPPPKLEGPELEQSLYAVGRSVAKSLEPFALSPGELAVVLRGVQDSVAGKPGTALDEKAQQSVQALFRERIAVLEAREQAASEAYLAKEAAEKGAAKTATGLVYLSIAEGTGPRPGASDVVRVNYVGSFVDGRVFDSTLVRGEPLDLPLNGVIPCWTEGIQKMKVGGKARLTCPSAIAYGPAGRPGQIPRNAVLTFEVELLSIQPPATPPAPAPAAPPAPPAPPAAKK
jgi:FKBP-type peptidyl-prolyl cis-trans isomerase